jgi:hypothetical protein
MANYTVIADVGETLIELLRDNMEDLIARDSIILFSPGEIEDDSTRLSLFMYQVVENDYLKNQEMRQVNSTALQYPPITLDLFYMMTSYPSTSIPDRTDRTLEEHRILGRAMRIFYDNAILRGSLLRGSLAGTDEELRIVLTTMNMENITQMWNSFEGKPYRPSVFYQVTPVPIDSTRQRDVDRVIEKDMRYYQMIAKKTGL